MKNLIRFSVFLLAIGLILISITDIYSANEPVTTNGTRITNIVFCTGANISVGARATNQCTNRLIVGAKWTCQTDIQNCVNGTAYSNVSFFTNLGNGTINFKIGVDNFKSNHGGDAWRWIIYTNAAGRVYDWGRGGEIARSNFRIPFGATRRIVFKVYITNTATNGSWELYRLYATTNNTLVYNTNTYRSDWTNNGRIIWYGGETNSQFSNCWGGGGTYTTKLPNRPKSVVWYYTGINTNSLCPDNNYTWKLRVAIPNMGISKGIFSISDPARMGLGIAIPGASITYQIIVSNTGLGAGNNIIIRDFINFNYLTNITGRTAVRGLVSTESNWDSRLINNQQVVFSNNDGSFNSKTRAVLRFTAVIK